jgi:3-dehydroquinate synthase
VVGDLAGFAAATFQRGVPFVQIPTTLLAQVDASVGGKTAVNHPAGKNLIGAFYQPRLVIIDVETLRTLPKREFVAGLAEVIKYGVILNADLFTLLEEQLARFLQLDADLLTFVIKTCCQLKALVVEEDETESDYRAILNFGHTLGHAIESATEYKQFLHGEAVAIGMAFASHLSHKRGWCSGMVEQRVRKLLKKAGLPVDIPKDLKGEYLLFGLATDKKMAGGKVKFVCLEDVGKTRFEYLETKEIRTYL